MGPFTLHFYGGQHAQHRKYLTLVDNLEIGLWWVVVYGVYVCGFLGVLGYLRLSGGSRLSLEERMATMRSASARLGWDASLP